MCVPVMIDFFYHVPKPVLLRNLLFGKAGFHFYALHPTIIRLNTLTDRTV